MHLEYLFQTYYGEETGQVHLHGRNSIKIDIIKKGPGFQNAVYQAK